MKNQKWLTMVLVGLLALTLTGLSVTGHHDPRIDNRIVHPYNVQVITHIPVVAGYEPVPAPQHCTIGAPSVLPFYEEDFSGDHGFQIVQTPLAIRGQNFWSVTDFEGRGASSDAGERLYFGHTSGPFTGTYRGYHPAGTAESPAIELPEAPSVLTFSTKWMVEYLAGYDHLWVEMEDEEGNLHLLCTSNGYGRVDQAGVSGNSNYQSCSPVHYAPCPASFNQNFHGIMPGWEQRSIQIPQVLWGQEVKLRFTFDSSDGAANHFYGWSVDDVSIGSPAL